MVTVTCQDCGRTMELNEHYVEDLLVTGDLVRGYRRAQKVVNDVDPHTGQRTGTQGEADDFKEKLFDICNKCKLKPGLPPGHPEMDRERRIQHKIKVLKEMRPDLSFEGRVHAAVEEEFDPKYEPHPLFRAYLVEKQGL